ncbi:hypothetical protein STIUS_v1c05820 [Spiroplasma sp. TIUS-1]|uniref:hypothetical protein n=1 Tax=Spiroplasma sp. TIUS-1 TaxID=216963 RepID=UPI0013973937|nr:hypothetical protein [Spiroplasma sp. TIUS-1]QHX36136.1 hypothetical protein STIUS_v1c05820 [Spiroplasma sp. TIUS-1]
MDKKKQLIKEQKKYAGGYLKLKPYLFAMFLVDQVVFLIALIFFILEVTMFKDNNQAWLNYSILGSTIYLLLKFTTSNWLSKNWYYKSLVVFKKKTKIDEIDMEIFREVSFLPLSFLLYIISVNFLTAVFINVEINNIFADNIVLSSFIEIAMNMLLLPSFLNTFNKIVGTNSKVDANYVKLLKDQYYSNKTLFEDTEFKNDYLNVYFKKVDLNSKKGIFVFKNSKDLTSTESNNIEKLNGEILLIYKEIWNQYYDLLQLKMKTKFKRSEIHTLYWIERIYDHIFVDFFEI